MVLYEQAYALAPLWRHGEYVLSKDAALSALWFQKSAQYVYGCGLAGAVLAEQPQYLSLWHCETQVFVDEPLAVGVGYVNAFYHNLIIFIQMFLFRAQPFCKGLRPSHTGL